MESKNTICKFKKLNIFNMFKLLKFLKSNSDVKSFFNPHSFTLKQLIKNMISKDYFVLQCSGKHVIGYGVLRGWEDGCIIPSLCILIDKHFRGAGLSKCMMEHLHQVAIEKDSNEIMLRVLKTNTRAINLYKILGYNIQPFDDELMIGYKKLI